jgi:CBS domain containing-hemolysin-like protein
MDDVPPFGLLAFRLGSRHFQANLLLATISVVCGLWAATNGFLAFTLGIGWAAPLLVSILLFAVLLLFKNFIFDTVYHDERTDVDAALLEYLAQQNSSQAHPEEEMTAEMLENALHLKEVRVYDCMCPRPEVIHIDVESSLDALSKLFIESKLSRIIVIEGDLDRVLGYVHVQQLFEKPTDIRQMVMPIAFVPETVQVSDMLNKFIRNRASIACVVDEYGSLSGIITLEDALEQLFGEIDDEHDQEEFIETQISETEFLFSGRLEVDYLNKTYPELQIPTGDYTTLSGYLVTEAQAIPEQGFQLSTNGTTFILELVSDRKIETVRILLNTAEISEG